MTNVMCSPLCLGRGCWETGGEGGLCRVSAWATVQRSPGTRGSEAMSPPPGSGGPPPCLVSGSQALPLPPVHGG